MRHRRHGRGGGRIVDTQSSSRVGIGVAELWGGCERCIDRQACESLEDELDIKEIDRTHHAVNSTDIGTITPGKRCTFA